MAISGSQPLRELAPVNGSKTTITTIMKQGRRTCSKRHTLDRYIYSLDTFFAPGKTQLSECTVHSGSAIRRGRDCLLPYDRRRIIGTDVSDPRGLTGDNPRREGDAPDNFRRPGTGWKRPLLPDLERRASSGRDFQARCAPGTLAQFPIRIGLFYSRQHLNRAWH